MLCRDLGTTLAYTPMMHADSFIEPCFVASAHGIGPLRTQPDDAPLVAHFCGNNAQTLLAAGRRAERYAVAVDLNLGCPQRSAHSAHYGAFLCDEIDRKLLLNIVSTMARGLRVPLFCKIRLLPDLQANVAPLPGREPACF